MIRCNIGEKCTLKGEPADLIAEFTQIISAFDALLSSKVGADAARKVIALCGKAAVAEGNDKKLYGDMIATVLHDAVDKS